MRSIQNQNRDYRFDRCTIYMDSSYFHISRKENYLRSTRKMITFAVFLHYSHKLANILIMKCKALYWRWEVSFRIFYIDSFLVFSFYFTKDVWCCSPGVKFLLKISNKRRITNKQTFVFFCLCALKKENILHFIYV